MEIINNNTFMEFGMNSLGKFMNGNIAENYTIQEEQGFPIQGAVGTILNIKKKQDVENVKNGLVVNPLNKTKNIEGGRLGPLLSVDAGINQLSPLDNNWVNPKMPQPMTPLKYCNDTQVSELLPKYPNGITNNTLTPNCKTLTLNNIGSPLLYGASTFGVNDSSLLTNPQNNIGHEIETFGLSNEYGARALGQGKNACKPMISGFNVPSLNTFKNENGSYISTPVSFNNDIPLYQVGDWTNIPGNFLHNFENADYCN
tara:strand:+ start:40 stop:810 length:771 start_codon:yes stop_codon:yes gene_type:complete